MLHTEITKLMEKDKAVLMFYITTKLLPEFNLIIALFIRHEFSQQQNEEQKKKEKCKSCPYSKC